MGIEILDLAEEKKKISRILSPIHFQFLSYKILSEIVIIFVTVSVCICRLQCQHLQLLFLFLYVYIVDHGQPHKSIQGHSETRILNPTFLLHVGRYCSQEFSHFFLLLFVV